jgi:hypothetical protein
MRAQDLQVQIRERHRRLLTSNYANWRATLRLVVKFLESQPVVRALLDQAARSEPEIETDAWIAQFIGLRGYAEPPYATEDGRATVTWRLMKRIAEEDELFNQVRRVGGHVNHADWAREFTDDQLSPLFDFLAERVGNQSALAYVLGRYVRQLEWFDRDRLYEQFQGPGGGESTYDKHLREFLYREGVDMPYSQAQSPAGESDALAALEGDEALVCELKVFDAENRDRSHLASGVTQALHYAHDYGKTDAYLVVIDVSDRPMQFPSDGATGVWPPYLDVAGVRVHIVAVRGFRSASASKLGTLRPVAFAREQLIQPEASAESVSFDSP